MGNFSGDGKGYKEELKADLKEAEVHLELGNALFSKGLIDEAMKEYMKP
ncbi:MAG: hypothetical protein HXY46_12370 [Syntrophaceae bacterium]|nr:hypothetical protein [Syntrophaceae bacterium]